VLLSRTGTGGNIDTSSGRLGELRPNEWHLKAVFLPFLSQFLVDES
jgi:hypothetical protein